MPVKPQDLVFIFVLIVLVFLRNPRLSTGVGLICIIASVPLFALWVFFTAERLTLYAAAFLLLAAIQYLVIIKGDRK